MGWQDLKSLYSGRQRQEGELKSAYKRPCLTSAPIHACICVYTRTFKGATERRELDKGLRSRIVQERTLIKYETKAYMPGLWSNKTLWLQEQGTTDSPGLIGE